MLNGFVNRWRLADLLAVIRSQRVKQMALFAWNIRGLHCYPAWLTALEIPHVVRNLVRVVFRFSCQKHESRRSGGW
jgi:hypothetical protein